MEISEIKSLILHALFLDDHLSELLVLKGGSALEIYKLSGRSSLDLDFSLSKILKTITNEDLKQMFYSAFNKYFKDKGFSIFSFKFESKPHSANDLNCLGYKILFKFLPTDIFDTVSSSGKNSDKRLHQEFIKFAGRHDVIQIELSKHEFCKTHDRKNLDDGLVIYIYTPEMILIEKLRAICQQMPEYEFRKRSSSRAKDFFDIYLLDNKYNIKERFIAYDQSLIKLTKDIFSIKKVDLSLIGKIDKCKSSHESSFQDLKDTVSNKENLESFDFYFDYVVDLANTVLKALK